MRISNLRPWLGLVLVMLVARDRKVMGDQTIGPLLTTLGWMATVGMFIALAGLAYTTFFAPS